MMYFYHYHAMSQVSVSETLHFDGIIRRERLLTPNADEYQQLKDDIRGKHCDNLVICSLTLLNGKVVADREG